MAAYRRVDDLWSLAGWLPVHRDQPRAQRSETSMGSLYIFTVSLGLNSSLATLNTATVIVIKEFWRKATSHVVSLWKIEWSLLLHDVSDDGMIPFSAYTNTFQWVGQSPKLPLSVGGSRPRLIHGSLNPVSYPSPNGISIGSAIFAQYISMIWVTNTQTDALTCDICRNTPPHCHEFAAA